MEIKNNEQLSKYYADTVSTEPKKYNWQKTRLVVVFGKDGSDHLEARKLSFFERIGALFGGRASFKRVIEFCDAHGLGSTELNEARQKYNGHIGDSIASSIRKNLSPKPQIKDIAGILKNRQIVKQLRKLNQKDAYNVLENIDPKVFGDVIFFNKMCPVFKQKDAHTIELPNNQSLNVEYTANTKLKDIRENIAKELPDSKVILLRKDIFKDTWIKIDISDKDDSEAWELDHLAIGIVDPSGKGAIYELPADQKVTDAHAAEKVDWESVD